MQLECVENTFEELVLAWTERLLCVTGQELSGRDAHGFTVKYTSQRQGEGEKSKVIFKTSASHLYGCDGELAAR